MSTGFDRIASRAVPVKPFVPYKRRHRIRAFFGWVLVWAGLVGFASMLLVLHRPRTPEPTTTPVTVQIGQTAIECVWYEDRANHFKSLSC